MLQPYKFLIIDDDAGNNLLCELVIVRAFVNAEVISFTSASKGIDYIKNGNTEKTIKTILFLDINMPTLSGWDVLAQFEGIKAIIDHNFTVYMLSSSVNPADKVRAENNRFVEGYLTKPLTKTLVLKLLGKEEINSKQVS
ncbi:MAG: response regulator [Sphingobacteriales bacterium JAD_PAG50586_3]|nr:MAG: response regulator [Sphingobacteriales bacterium JAD_PAG50586_3]